MVNDDIIMVKVKKTKMITICDEERTRWKSDGQARFPEIYCVRDHEERREMSGWIRCADEDNG